MRIIFELFLFLGIYFPIYHILNMIFSLKSSKEYITDVERPLTIIIPCYNEEDIIKNTVEGLIRVEYVNYECIFVNDGSKDKTFKTLRKELKLIKINRKKIHNLDSKYIKQVYQSNLYPNIFVINKQNGGKSDALNAGINYAKNDYIVTLDADSILKSDALKIVSNAFNDKNVIAASGIIQILQSFNLSRTNTITTLRLNWLLKLQTIEYMKSCFCYKASLAKLKSLLVISGAFGIFKKEILLEVNGFNHVVGEDLDLTLKIQFKIIGTNKKIAYLPNAICYTEGPEKFKDFIKQRRRWQASFIESLFNYSKLIFKRMFTKTLPFFMVVDALFIGVLSSFIIIIFYIFLLASIIESSMSSFLVYLMIFIGVHLLYNVVGVLIGSYYGIKYRGFDKIRLIFTIILDVIFYRIVILYTIIIGTVAYFTNENIWNKVKRSGRNYDVLKKG